MNKASIIFFSIFFWIAAAAMAAGCASHNQSLNKDPLEAEVIYQGAFCGPVAEDPGFLWIDDSRQLESLLKQAANTPGTAPLAARAADFDFSEHRILAIFMGQRPTAGYSLAYIPERSYVSGATAFIAIKHITPPPDAITAQVITRPCLLLKLERRITDCQLFLRSEEIALRCPDSGAKK